MSNKAGIDGEVLVKIKERREKHHTVVVQCLRDRVCKGPREDAEREAEIDGVIPTITDDTSSE